MSEQSWLVPVNHHGHAADQNELEQQQFDAYAQVHATGALVKLWEIVRRYGTPGVDATLWAIEEEGHAVTCQAFEDGTLLITSKGREVLNNTGGGPLVYNVTPAAKWPGILERAEARCLRALAQQKMIAETKAAIERNQVNI